MAVQPVGLTSEESYLLSIIQDESGIDLAEFLWEDPNADNEEKVFRCWDFQYAWWRDIFANGKKVTDKTRVVDACARSVGKTMSIILRAWAFPLQHPGSEMVVTAPELIHLDPLTSRIEDRIKETRITRELLPKRVGLGFKHRPFAVNFVNGAKLLGRIPQRDGRGMKGTHPLKLEMDECFPADTLVLTSHGYKAIAEITAGELVWTHRNRWRRVVKVFDRGFQDMVQVRGQGHPGLVCSASHKFWVSEEQVVLVLSTDVNGRPSRKRSRVVSEPTFVPANDLRQGFFWATPSRLDFMRHVPNMVGVGHSPDEIWEHQLDVFSEDWAWLCGLWVAEGSAGDTQCTWSVHNDEVAEVSRRMIRLGIPYAAYPLGACTNITVYSSRLCEYMTGHFGKGAHNKRLPMWLLRLKRRRWRRACFEGAVFGDGNTFQNGWTYTTVSKELALGISLLATSLDYQGVGVHLTDAQHLAPSVVRGREIRRGCWYQVRVSRVSNETYVYDKKRWGRVREVQALEQMHCYDLEVEEDHSFVVENIVVSNSQDYPHAGWVETTETLLHGKQDAQWRAHGVSRGVRDDFFSKSQPNSGWTVHRLTAMHRSTWSDAERQSKIEEYGSRNSPDYKRNLLGEHGDATNPLFVLHRLMAAVDDDPGSEYNEQIFYLRRVTEEMIREQPLELLIDPPKSHTAWKNTWAGMDIGLTSAPSEILVWGEETLKGQVDVVLRLLARFHLERVSSPDQRKIVEMLFEHYNLRLLTLDRGGMGLPIFQEIQSHAPKLLERVKAYTADENVVVGYDAHEDWENPDDFEIKRRAKEHGYDLLRTFVDKKRFILPWDRDLLTEWQGQTWTPDRSETNPYGRKIFSRGKFHTLDAAAMMILGKELSLLEQLQEAKKESELVPLIVL